MDILSMGAVFRNVGRAFHLNAHMPERNTVYIVVCAQSAEMAGTLTAQNGIRRAQQWWSRYGMSQTLDRPPMRILPPVRQSSWKVASDVQEESWGFANWRQT